MRSLIRNTLLLLGLLWLAHRFLRWRQRLLQRLTRRSQIVQTVHGEIEYILRGTGDAVVLLIHGSPGGCDFWRLYQDVIDAGYRILCPSCPGYLRTPHTSGQSLGAQSQLCIALLDALQIEQVAVIGFSGGAPLAFQLAIDAPHRIQSVVIESGVTHRINIANTPEEWLLNLSNTTALLQRPLYWLAQRIVRALPGVALWLTFWFTTSHSWTGTWRCMRHILRSPRQVRAFWRLFDANLPFSQRQAGYANDIRIMQILPMLPFERIHQPVLLLHSRYDRDVPLEHAQSAQTQLPNAQLIIIEGCGHFIWLGEHGRQVLARRNAFLHTTHSVTVGSVGDETASD